MGSTPEHDKEITVLVTGFGSFSVHNPTNPSWEIAKSLPPFLPPPPQTASDISYVKQHPPVRILVHPEPIRVAYENVCQLVPSLWDQQKVDYMIHIGMATGRRYYSVERRGHRDGYKLSDVDGKTLACCADKDHMCPVPYWDDMPAELLSDCDIDDTWCRWRIAVPNTDVRISEDPGRYLCDFIYFSSLAYLERHGQPRRVVFVHVPVNVDEQSIQVGVTAVLELIRAIVQSGRMKDLTLPSNLSVQYMLNE
ncbi:hypothetical protein BJ878DRAFT_422704 [Calycina marina]|uniref:Pyroglutamyl-peptidase I n=1 Tax=Calycina marina TaxID=1763456 RepID=A0A9P7Z1F8_9HELO|nr:hypothetical protein BJ878DRAFT_422704 [Calycina marina]